MQTINLKQYYPFCTEDTFVEVSDEIVEAFLLDKRAEVAGSARCTATRRFTPLTAMMGLRTPPSAGRMKRIKAAQRKSKQRAKCHALGAENSL